MISEEGDIKAVRTQEERRGKRPIDIAARKRRHDLLRKFREALESNDVEQFTEALIRDLGQLPGTPEYAQSLKIWNEHHGAS
jgi:hypothetical protein